MADSNPPVDDAPMFVDAVVVTTHPDGEIIKTTERLHPDGSRTVVSRETITDNGDRTVETTRPTPAARNSDDSRGNKTSTVGSPFTAARDAHAERMEQKMIQASQVARGGGYNEDKKRRDKNDPAAVVMSFPATTTAARDAHAERMKRKFNLASQAGRGRGHNGNNKRRDKNDPAAFVMSFPATTTAARDAHAERMKRKFNQASQAGRGGGHNENKNEPVSLATPEFTPIGEPVPHQQLQSHTGDIRLGGKHSAAHASVSPHAPEMLPIEEPFPRQSQEESARLDPTSNITSPSYMSEGDGVNEVTPSVQLGAVRVLGIDHPGSDEQSQHSGSAENRVFESVSANQFENIDIHIPEAEPVTPEPEMEMAVAKILEYEKFGITIFGRRFHILFVAAFVLAIVGAAVALAVIFSSSGDDPLPPPLDPDSCDTGEVRFDVSIKTDAHGNETLWSLVDNEDVPILFGMNYGDETTYTAGVCLSSPGYYLFQIGDMGLNGMCCAFGKGSYEIFLDDESVASGGNFSDVEVWEITLDGDQVSVSQPELFCEPGEVMVEVVVTADENGDEIIWALSENGSEEALLFDLGQDDMTTNTQQACLSLQQSYTFEISDLGGNGICCSSGEGGYEIFLNGTLFASGGEFKFSDTQEIRFDTGSVTCEHGEIMIEVNITTDLSGAETSWDITDNENGNAIASGRGYGGDSTYSSKACLSLGRNYTFTIRDSHGDGMCCTWGDGSYEVYLDGNSVAYGGVFSDDEAWELVLDEDQVRVNYASCEVGEVVFEVKITTDQSGWETSWVLSDDESNEVASVPTYTYGDESTYTRRECLSLQRKYTFTIEDSALWGGDGICCSNGEGRYELLLGGNLVSSGGEFTDRETWEIDVHQFSATKVTLAPTLSPTLAPTEPSLPTASSCNVSSPNYIGDGYCDMGEYNTESCDYDGGDCCESTCTDGPSYQCGISGYDCKDPAASRSGSNL